MWLTWVLCFIYRRGCGQDIYWMFGLIWRLDWGSICLQAFSCSCWIVDLSSSLAGELEAILNPSLPDKVVLFFRELCKKNYRKNVRKMEISVFYNLPQKWYLITFITFYSVGPRSSPYSIDGIAQGVN